jgi:transcriptional enhancer factor
MHNEAAVAHKFTKLGTEKHRTKLESVIGWRQKFPHLNQLDTMGELNCDIIHMDATLNLLSTEPPPGSELVSQSILSIPGKQTNHCVWRMVTTLHKPPELYRDPMMDERLENEVFPVDVISKTESETRIKASFPIFHWAHAFSCLVGIQAQYDEHQRSLQSYGTSSDPLSRPAREYVEQVAMYQEVQSAAALNMPFIRRAVIIWTFHQTREGEGNSTNWRYLDAAPARRMCMSPSPHPSHLASSAMNENFNSWAETPLLLQQSMLDPFVQGLATPPQSAGLQPAFGTSPYPFSGSGFDLPVGNLSFISSTTVDSEVTLVDHEASTNIDHFLLNVNMADYSQDASQDPSTWQLPATENFDADPAWAYTVPSSTPAVGWDDAKTPAWPDLPDTKNTNWTDDTSSKHEWIEPGSPSKQMSYIEQNIEQKLLPWIEGHRDEDSQSILQNESTPLQEVDANATIHTPKATEEWNHSDDGFDYAGLVERLK